MNCCYYYCPLDWKVPYTNVALMNDPILREICFPIPFNTIHCKETQFLIKHLVDTMRKFELVGLSAPQIGIPLRIIVMEFPEHLLRKIPANLCAVEGMEILPLIIAINPILYVRDGKQIILQEKCASIPGYSGNKHWASVDFHLIWYHRYTLFLANVARFEEVYLIALNQFGQQISLRLTGWNARVAQHEIDHLDGRLYIDVMDLSTLVCYPDFS